MLRNRTIFKAKCLGKSASCRACFLALLAHAQKRCLLPGLYRRLAFLWTLTTRAISFRRPWSNGGLPDHHALRHNKVVISPVAYRRFREASRRGGRTRSPNSCIFACGRNGEQDSIYLALIFLF